MRKAIFVTTVIWVIALVVVPLADYLFTAFVHPNDVTDGELIRGFGSSFLVLTGVYLPVILLLLTASWAFKMRSRNKQKN